MGAFRHFRLGAGRKACLPPVGGEAQAIRALYQLLKERYPAR